MESVLSMLHSAPSGESRDESCGALLGAVTRVPRLSSRSSALNQIEASSASRPERRCSVVASAVAPMLPPLLWMAAAAAVVETYRPLVEIDRGLTRGARWKGALRMPLGMPLLFCRLGGPQVMLCWRAGIPLEMLGWREADPNVVLD